MARQHNDLQKKRRDFYDTIAQHNLSPLWEVLDELVPPTPRGPVKPALWRYADVRPFIALAGDLIGAAEAVRRVLILENPGLPNGRAITRSVYAGLQLVLPGEVAPCHRHAQSALRFVLEGAGAFTAVDGERVYMNPFDLVLTPSGRWHDHGNETDAPMIWLDGLDIPLLTALDCGYAETYSTPAYPTTESPGASTSRFAKNMRPVPSPSDVEKSATYPLFHYPYASWRATLEDLRKAGPPDAHLGYKMEFVNPSDGGAAMATMSCFGQLVQRGTTTTPLRTSDATVYVVCEGAAQVTIDDDIYNAGARDVFVVPSWKSLRLAAPETDVILFSFSDRAIQRTLGLWRQAAVPT